MEIYGLFSGDIWLPPDLYMCEVGKYFSGEIILLPLMSALLGGLVSVSIYTVAVFYYLSRDNKTGSAKLMALVSN